MFMDPVSTPERTKISGGKSASGRLFYFMGPSGVGKDTILNTLREIKNGEVFFATRYITRPVTDGGETHIELSKETFQKKRQEGFFAFAWQSHGFFYGISARIFSIMDEGWDVIVNGSRGYFPKAEKVFPDIIPVLVTASEATVLQRLKTRGREPEAEINRRLHRLKNFSIDHKSLIPIENESTPEAAANLFLSKAQRKTSDARLDSCMFEK
ncbi:ribose 1,5-bisphosphokinase [Desulfocicer vacuolatum DSM 3385]|uniref:ribose 1,5-bisphosphate phosphokinase n=2 Tax=Desulfocicer vacuolatum TaxID=2298 RepID=A0A1W2ESK4_9BACT|nr:ribose 1,5-bisphosphokinase [Desulfocicer vacuolatum DSM 3385]